jgi:hypothetical protein
MRKPAINVVTVEEFGQKFACEVSTLPGNVVLPGWAAEATNAGRSRSVPSAARSRSIARSTSPESLRGNGERC